MMKISKKIITLSLAVATFTSVASAQGLKGLGSSIKNAAGNLTGGSNKGKGLSDADISAGLKEALKVGAQNATGRVSSINGFFGDAAIKVLMPPEAKKVETTLRSIGMGAQVDKAILAMNRAAEDASSKALPIFVNAVSGMTIQDGVSILRGSNDAATLYLRNKTTNDLTLAFKPVIKASLDKVNATKYWAQVVNIYNRLPTTRTKVNPDLPAYVTDRALNGIFVYVAREEQSIRSNPAARVSDLLKKVFG
jgi:hypothetical protein